MTGSIIGFYKDNYIYIISLCVLISLVVSWYTNYFLGKEDKEKHEEG